MLQRLRRPSLYAGESQALRPTRPCEAPSGPRPAAVRGDPSRSPQLNRWSPTQTLQPVAVEAQALRLTTVEASSKSGCSRTDAGIQASAQRSASHLGTDSARAVVLPGVTSLVRLTYGLAARERLSGRGAPPRVSRRCLGFHYSRISHFSHSDIYLIRYLNLCDISSSFSSPVAQWQKPRTEHQEAGRLESKDASGESSPHTAGPRARARSPGRYTCT